jgi:15-cis-phytoene synthase
MGNDRNDLNDLNDLPAGAGKPAGNGEAALRESYALCRRMHARSDRSTYMATRLLLPPAIRPHAHALHAYFTASDIIADEGDPAAREGAFARWSAEVLDELCRGHSEHPLRRALVDTACTYGLELELFERFQVATGVDGARTADFGTFEDLRGFLREVSGTSAVLGIRLLGPPTSDIDRLASLMGEVFQLVDIFRDFPEDLPRQRLFVPTEDLDRFGVDRAELINAAPTAALDALVRFQVERARAMQHEAAALVELLPIASKPITAAGVAVHNANLDLVERLGARVLREGAELSRVHLLRLAWPHVRTARRRFRTA